MRETCVSVGVGIGGQKEIMDSLARAGYNVEHSVEQWPRDSWVYFNGKYISRGGMGIEGNVFGDGGNVHTGEDFVMVSDNAFWFNDVRNKIKENFGCSENDINNSIYKNYEEASKIVSDCGKEFFNSRVHIAPTGYYQGKIGQTHIDLFSLLLPKSKILLFDKHYGKDANAKNHYNRIAEKENLKFIEFDGSKDGVWYPLNSCILPYNSGDAVVLDSKSQSLKKILDKEGVKIIQVDMPQIEYPAGKINCQTNMYRVNDRKIVRSIEENL